MKKTSKLFSLLALLAVCFPLFAQSDQAPCGTNQGISPWLRDFQRRIDSAPRTDDIIYVPLQVHVVGTDEGSGYFSNNGIMNAFCTLNEDFVQANIQFFMPNPFNYIDNTIYYDHDYDAGYDMMAENNLSNIINCYIVDSPAGNCGYFFPSVDGIALSKGCVGPNDHTWAHEVGHFLSLPHPFYGWEGQTHNYDLPAPDSWDGWEVERLDGSNCLESGDGFCDTAADYLNYRWSCNNSFTSTVQQTDPNGETFVSDGALFMSYSNPFCKSTFSEDQIAAMRANIEEVRSNLITDPPVLDDIAIEAESELTITNLAPDELIETANFRLEWEPISGATQYVVQVNPFNIFSIVFEEYIVEEAAVNLTELRPDETYYFRVRPSNPYETCAEFTSSASFSTGAVVSTTELFAGERLEVFPNPVTGDALQVNLRLNQSQSGQWRLLDATGTALRQDIFNATTTNQRLSVAVSDVPTGMYFLQFVLTDRQIVRKVIIQ